MSTAAAHIEEDHGHHHKETFVTKYVFSQDHKMISKQYFDYRIIYGNYRNCDVPFISIAIGLARATLWGF